IAVLNEALASSIRTRMIVFPSRRSVRLNAATASSRVETLPMFVRSRPSRTRWTSSLNWARSGTTTKSIVRPPEGRASVGPAMVTSVPPARITPADRFAMSPPRTSNTRSTPPTSSRASLSRSTNSCAPKSRAVRRPAACPVPMTYAPASHASWLAIEPTTPAAPCTRTLCPARRRPCSNSPCHAVRPGITSAAPTVKSTSPGSGVRLRASTATYSASVPSRYQSVHDSKDLLREISARDERWLRRLSAATCWCSLIPTVCFSLAPADLDYSKSQSFNNAQSTRPVRQIADAKPTRSSEPERFITGGKAGPCSRWEVSTFGPIVVFFRASENPSSSAPFRTPLARNMVTPFLIAYYRSFGIILEHFSAHEDDRICVSITCAPEIAYSKQRFG